MIAAGSAVGAGMVMWQPRESVAESLTQRQGERKPPVWGNRSHTPPLARERSRPSHACLRTAPSSVGFARPTQIRPWRPPPKAAWPWGGAAMQQSDILFRKGEVFTVVLDAGSPPPADD